MRVLLLDTNVSSYPIYESLIEDGYEVFVAGSNPNDCLALVSENYLQFNYSNFEELKKQVKKNKIEIVLPGCNDVSYTIASLYNDQFNTNLNIEAPKIDYLLNNKDAFKQFAIQIGLKVPKKIKLSELSNSNFTPIIIKPTDSFSGKGVTVIHDYDKLGIEKAISIAISNSKSQGYVIEEFVQGQLYSHSCFIIDGKIELDFIVEEHCIHYPFAVDKSWVVDHSDCSFLNEIRGEIQKIINALELKPGLLHTQFISTEGGVKILEVTRRCPGDLYSKLVEYSTGINYAYLYTQLIFKIDCGFKLPIQKNKIIRETIHKSENVFFFVNLESYNGIKEFVPIVKTGFLTSLSFSRIGILFYYN